MILGREINTPPNCEKYTEGYLKDLHTLFEVTHEGVRRALRAKLVHGEEGLSVGILGIN